MRTIIVRIVLALFVCSITIYSHSDTVVVTLSKECVDTIVVSNNEWQSFYIDISSLDRDSISRMSLGVCFRSLALTPDTGEFYIKEIALLGSDTTIIENFSGYTKDSINGPSESISSTDKVWFATWAWDGSEMYAAIIKGEYNYLHCYYTKLLRDVGSFLQLKFSSGPRDWSNYNTLRFTLRSDMSTGLISQRRHTLKHDITIKRNHKRGMTIELPTHLKSAQISLYSLSGRLLIQKQSNKVSSSLWHLPPLPNGTYIIAIDDGVRSYSDMLLLRK